MTRRTGWLFGSWQPTIQSYSYRRASWFTCHEKCMGGQCESITSGYLTQMYYVRFYVATVY